MSDEPTPDETPDVTVSDDEDSFGDKDSDDAFDASDES